MKKIDKSLMAKSYVEMGEINLSICKESFHLEEEGERLSEMVATKAEGSTE